MFGKKKAPSIGGSLISGLDVPEGSFVQITASSESLKLTAVISTGKVYQKEFNLAVSKIKYIRLMNEQEIKQVIEQSKPGMILGAAAFGVIGAMIGGRVKTKEKKTLKQILVIDYGNQIVLDCSGELFTTQNAFMKYVNNLLPENIDDSPIEL